MISRMNWRRVSDFIKHRDWPLHLADRLGKGRGRLRVDDWYTHVNPAPVCPDLSGWDQYRLAVLWIGHATVLLRIGGMTILTDPVFSTRIGLGLGLITVGPQRLYRPAVRLTQLPPLDAILISHAHFDHLDRPSLVRLSKRVPVIAARGLRDLIQDLGFQKIVELDWEASWKLGNVCLTAIPVQHWGARTFLDRHRGFCGFLIESSKDRLVFGADTAYQTYWKLLAPVDLAMVGIGAYDPYVAAHATPEQAWEMARYHLQARYVIPIHHSTFRLSQEPVDEPMRRLLQEAGEESSRVVIRRIGDMFVTGSV